MDLFLDLVESLRVEPAPRVPLVAPTGPWPASPDAQQFSWGVGGVLARVDGEERGTLWTKSDSAGSAAANKDGTAFSDGRCNPGEEEAVLFRDQEAGSEALPRDRKDLIVVLNKQVESLKIELVRSQQLSAQRQQQLLAAQEHAAERATAADKDATASSDGHISDINKQFERVTLELKRMHKHLLATQELAAERATALESLAYISKIPTCDICFESMGSGTVFWMLKTACGHEVCTRCWKLHSKASPRAAQNGASLCPWNTCVLRDEAGRVLFNGECASTVTACSIVSEFTRDDLLEGIEHAHKLFEKTIASSVLPDKVPALLKEYVDSTEQRRQRLYV